MSCDDTSSGSTLTLYKDRDNAVTVIPYSEYTSRTNYDLSDITRITVDADAVASTTVGDAIVGDSDIDDTLVWWAEVTNADGLLEWRIFCKVGLFTGITAGDYTLRITLYDAAHPNGLVLPSSDTDLIVTIMDLP